MKHLIPFTAMILAFSTVYSANTAFCGQEADQPAFLGIQSTNISEEKASKLGFEHHYGSYVTSVIKGTAADRAGIQPFDYLFGIDAYRTGEDQRLGQIIRQFNAGDKATLHLVRKGKTMEVPVTFGARADVEQTYTAKCERPFLGVRHSHKVQPDQGVGVTIIGKSTAEALGMADNDLITAINGQTMIDWQDISTAVNNLRAGQTITVEFLRDGRKLSGSQPIKSYCDTPGAEDHDDSYDYDYDYDYNFNYQPWSGQGNRSTPGSGMDLSRVKIRLEPLAEADKDGLRRAYNIDLSTADDLRIEGLQLIPNPGTGLFDLQFNLPGRGPTSIHIYNPSGRQIYNYELGNFSGAFSDEVDISQNGSGLYFLEIRQDQKSAARKILLSQN